MMMFDDLDRPLGRDLIRPPLRRRRWSLTAHVLPLMIVSSLVAGSAATAFLQPALRKVDVFAEAAAKRDAEAQAAASAPVAPVPRGPSIVSAPLPAPDDLPTVTYPPSLGRDAGQTILVSDPAGLRQSPVMAASPEDALLEPSDVGPLPIRDEAGRRPFDVYSVEPSTGLGTRVAIVVGGLGISQTGTQAAVAKLPIGVTFGFAPAGNSLDRWMKESRRKGHELVLQLPMEPFGYPQTSPGPNTLTAEDAAAGAFDALYWSLGRLTNYVGVMNYMGARVTADPSALRPLLGELTRRGLLFLDDASSSRSLAKDTAHETGAIFAASDVLIDASQEPDAIARQLDTLERVARADGTAIGIASAFDTSVDAIAMWAAEAEKRGIKLVPLSALATDPEAR